MEAYIAGTIPQSSVEWEGTAAMLIFFAGCNFRCPYCFSSSILEPKSIYRKDLRDVRKEMEIQAPLLDGVLFCGGEPTQQRQAVLTLSLWAKELGLKVGMETNGTRPSLIKEMIEGNLLDHVILDLKSPFDGEQFEKITRSATFFKPVEDTIAEVKETLALLHQRKVSIVIRTTIIPSLMYRLDHIKEIAAAIKDLVCTWELRPFVPQESVVSRHLSQVKSPSTEFLEDLRQSCLVTYPQLNIVVKAATGY